MEFVPRITRAQVMDALSSQANLAGYRAVIEGAAAFGKAMSPHLFRDAAATTMATADPGNVRVAAPVLGHRTFAPTERHYIQATGLQAQAGYLKVIKERRQSDR